MGYSIMAFIFLGITGIGLLLDDPINAWAPLIIAVLFWLAGDVVEAIKSKK